jgi:hypothetical protein
VRRPTIWVIQIIGFAFAERACGEELAISKVIALQAKPSSEFGLPAVKASEGRGKAQFRNPPHVEMRCGPQNFFYAYGLWDLSWIEWIWDDVAPDVRAKKNLPGPKDLRRSACELEGCGSEDANGATTQSPGRASRDRSLLL